MRLHLNMFIFKSHGTLTLLGFTGPKAHERFSVYPTILQPTVAFVPFRLDM